MNKNLADILKTEYPIIQGGMARIATGIFAAVCSNAGGVGVIASGGIDARSLAEEIDSCRQVTNGIFAVNVIANHPEFDIIKKMVVEKRVPMVITGNGVPLKEIAYWKSEDIIVAPVIGTPAFAKYIQKAGADFIIAEGSESGGHVGSMTTMTLVPQICDCVDIPVIAAGGIADNRQYKAAIALGACGVQIGTALLVCEECPVHDDYKNALIKAKSTDNTLIGVNTGDPIRLLRNKLTQTYKEKESGGATKEELDYLIKGTLYKAAVLGDTKNGSVMAGLVCGQIKQKTTVRDLFKRICGEET